jgi:peptide deformylase
MRLLYYPDPRLRRHAKPVKVVDENLRKIIKEMFEVMYRHKGVGLAGPQVGMEERIMIVDISEQKNQPRVFINPFIKRKMGELNEPEGCLSFPQINVQIKRAEIIEVFYEDLDKKFGFLRAEGLLSRIIQHEIDHLDGILILDRMSPAQKSAVKAILSQLEKDFQQKRKTRKKVYEGGRI